jgi:multiple sugar transport system ATP-binding protein
MALVEVKNITKSFGHGHTVLDNITFTVPDNTFFTLLGPSGCGKTTLLRIIAGLENPDEGIITIGGRDVSRIAPARRNIAMVFQSYALYPHMTVFNNIATPLRLRGVKDREIQRRVAETAELLGIRNHLKKRPGPLSGGERQRVALARALVRKPDVFLMDEPLSNLDALLRERTRTELKMLFSRIGATVIYVTHDQVEAMAMSDMIVVLHDGAIQQTGSPLDIYAHPENQFVAGFVGSPRMNFLRAVLHEDALVFHSGRSLPVPERFRHTGGEFPQNVTVGFRPEDAAFDGNGVEFAGNILAVEALGFQTIVSVDTPEGEVKILSTRHDYERRMSVSFSVPQDKIHLFSDPEGRICGRHVKR